MSQIRSVDQDVLMEVVMKIGFDRQELEEALEKQERNQMTVAYYLILDSKRRRLLSSSAMMQSPGQLDVAAPPPPPAAAAQPQPLIQPQQLAESAAMLAASSVQRGAPEAVQRRWHLGVQSSMSPADMMLEIFRALRVLQFEWKIVAQYSLKCRPCTARTASEGMGQEPMTRFKVKVGLQLYKIQEDSYLLDIRKVLAATSLPATPLPATSLPACPRPPPFAVPALAAASLSPQIFRRPRRRRRWTETCCPSWTCVRYC